MIEISSMVVIGLIIALGQLFKQLVPTRFIPLVSVALGVIAGLWVLPNDGLVSGIVNGLAMGLSACGLFDLGKAAVR